MIGSRPDQVPYSNFKKLGLGAATSGSLYYISPQFVETAFSKMFSKAAFFNICVILFIYYSRTRYQTSAFINVAKLAIQSMRRCIRMRQFQSMLVRLPTFNYRAATIVNNKCLICLDDLITQDTVLLACQHVFHQECFGMWYNRCDSCPYCRSRVR
ncbi:hypothetical protein KL919_002001 [Ogataea angusta]|nr:hypothetical protein KL943_002316 [Ogataea angusta]KAG7861267.1 hypothetical protein KL919_002001 [Ogataea angusta]